MARANTLTHTLLNRWPVVEGEDLFRFNQILGTNVSVQACPVYIQADRDEIATALNKAITLASRQLNYWPLPHWGSKRVSLRRGVPFWRQPLGIGEGYLQAFGRRATTLIEADVNVVYTDSDGDNALDTATITVTTAAADDEIAVFFKTSDGAFAAADARWEIDTLTKSRSGGTVTLSGHRGLFVSPNNVWKKPYEAPNYNQVLPGNNADAADFVTEVDVYRVYTDPTDAVRLRYLDCNGDYASESVAGRIEDEQLGRFSIGGDLCGYWSKVVYIDIEYQAGLPSEYGLMNPVLEEMLIRLANTYIPKGQCSFCDRVNTHFSYDNQEQPMFKGLEPYTQSFGTRRGQVNAAMVVRDMALVLGGALLA